MKSYKINEIFYSIQGEGINAGRPAIFIRFSGCNLHCHFCDTDHTDGTHMPIHEILRTVKSFPSRFIVLTGGEPSLFIDETLIDTLHQAKYEIAIETNGTHVLPRGIDHVTLSPKDDFCQEAVPVITTCDELKVVYTGHNNPQKYIGVNAKQRVLQPCDTGDPVKNREIIAEALEYCLRNPEWRLSLQLHKIMNIR